MSKKERQPWNPFPLASLKVEGLSACAKSILIYLAARSNHKGETCVGHRTMCRELVRSKDFVTTGLKELEGKGLVKASPRGRKKSEADWRTISPSILKSRIEPAECNPEEQDYNGEMKSCLAGLISPEEQDYKSKCNPAQQGETLQINQNPNLTDENLADSNEGRKERTLSSPQPKQEQQLRLLSEEQTKIAEAWAKGKGHAFVTGDAEKATYLAGLFGLSNVIAYVEDTFRCPKTAKVAWKDFSFWADNFDLTRRNIEAWRRAKVAKAVAAGQPAYRAESGRRDIFGKGDI